ncbi:hypothetical protein [Rugamonas aquatica]|uniref:hypothetical protein n=1 Tax=Rugamonas aquatica TaxID=2743357 RepID=UPI0015836EC7|nr:hypothetical protein [Rugamonas aquatica]
MNLLKTEVGDFGPFFFSARQEGGWLCDGVLYPDSVVGGGELVQVMHDDPTP